MALQGKVVVITGASDGIGAELATLCSARGARVVLTARRQPQLEAVARTCTDALVVAADVTDRRHVEDVMTRAKARYGQVDVWVNNAGRGITQSALSLTDDDFDEMMRVNVKSALYGMQVAAAHFIERREGQIVNVSSMLSRVPFAPGRSAYSAAKHALNSLTANVRDELKALAPSVRVTLVLPGVVATQFGLNARGGGPDSRALPNAQPVREVAEVIAGSIEQPVDEVYTRPSFMGQVVDYFSKSTR